MDLLGILRVGKFVFEHAPAQIITAPAQIIIALAQIIAAPAQPPATGAVVYTALFFSLARRQVLLTQSCLEATKKKKRTKKSRRKGKPKKNEQKGRENAARVIWKL